MKNKTFWYIYGYHHPCIVAVKQSLKDVEYDADSNAYWINEPIGHGISQDKMLTRKQAEKEIEMRKSNLSIYPGRRKKTSTLHEARIIFAEFILRTQGNKTELEDFLALYPKEENVEWFS